MEGVYKRIVKHWMAIALAVIVGLIVVGPNLVFTHSPGYEGIPIFGIQDEPYYVARLQAAYVGCFWNCNVFVPQAHPLAFSDASLSEPILVIPGILFHFTAVQLDIFFEFFFPFVLTLLFYSLLYRLTKSRFASLFGSFVIMCGFDLSNIDTPISIVDFLWIFHPLPFAYSSFLTYTRPVNPQFSSCIFLVYAHILLSYFKSRKNIFLIWISLLTALAWYTYLYLSTYLLVVNCVVLAVLLFQKDSKDMFKYGIAFVASFILAIPLLLNFFASLHQGPTLSSQFIRHTHSLEFTYVGISFLLTFFILGWIYLSRYPKNQSFYFISSFVLASYLVLEQQVLTGIEPEVFHYRWYYGTPVMIFVICFFASKFTPSRFKSAARILAVSGMVVVLLSAVRIQYESYLHWYPYTMSLQKYMPTLQKLQSEPQGQIYTSQDEDMTNLVPIYTHDYVPDAPYAFPYYQI